MQMATSWTIDGVKDALAAKKISARELAAEFYTRIDAKNPALNAYLTLSPERARRQTDRIDALLAEGKPLPPLAGVPVAIKDDMWLEDFAELRSSVRCDGGGASGGRRSSHSGKDQLR